MGHRGITFPRFSRRAKARPVGRRTGTDQRETDTTHIDLCVRAHAYQVDQGCRDESLCAREILWDIAEKSRGKL